MTDYDDEDLLALLRDAALVADAVPVHVQEFARAAFSFRDLDAQLAQIVRDSSDPALAGGGVQMRGPGAPRSLTFEVDDVVVDVEVIETDAGRRIVGLAMGAGEGHLAVEYADGATIRTPIDHLGRFATDARPGQARLRLDDGLGRPVVTPWTAL